jgi:hypothetical protein
MRLRLSLYFGTASLLFALGGGVHGFLRVP